MRKYRQFNKKMDWSTVYAQVESGTDQKLTFENLKEMFWYSDRQEVDYRSGENSRGTDSSCMSGVRYTQSERARLIRCSNDKGDVGSFWKLFKDHCVEMCF
jgi:hypothetical protein